MAVESFVTRAELNGSLLRLEDKIDKIHRVLGEGRDREEQCRVDMRREIKESTSGLIPISLSLVIAVLTSSCTGLIVALVR